MSTNGIGLMAMMGVIISIWECPMRHTHGLQIVVFVKNAVLSFQNVQNMPFAFLVFFIGETRATCNTCPAKMKRAKMTTSYMVKNCVSG